MCLWNLVCIYYNMYRITQISEVLLYMKDMELLWWPSLYWDSLPFRRWKSHAQVFYTVRVILTFSIIYFYAAPSRALNSFLIHLVTHHPCNMFWVHHPCTIFWVHHPCNMFWARRNALAKWKTVKFHLLKVRQKKSNYMWKVPLRYWWQCFFFLLSNRSCKYARIEYVIVFINLLIVNASLPQSQIFTYDSKTATTRQAHSEWSNLSIIPTLCNSQDLIFMTSVSERCNFWLIERGFTVRNSVNL